MSREIKFRAWNPITNRMIYPEQSDCAFWFTDDGWECISHFTGKPESLFNNEDEGSSLLQFTGLSDKNGKEIWEGDIVESETYGIGEYIFKGGCFIWHRGNHLSVTDQVVIGNIHENPELLK